MTSPLLPLKTPSLIIRLLAVCLLLLAVPSCLAVCFRRCVSLSGSLSCPNAGCTVIPVDEIHSDTQQVSLQSNVISAVPVLRNCSGVRSLNLAGNNIRRLASGAFRACANLRVLNLTDNAIWRLSSDHFAGLARLRQLFLNRNELTSLESNLFYRYLSSLQTLDLSENQIATLDPNALTDLRHLVSLHLSDNKLSSIETIHFLGLESLRDLNLNGNEIENLTIANFVECRSLELLDLSENRLSVIPFQTFIGLNSLKVLRINGNRLRSLQSTSLQVPGLQVIYLDDNPLTHLPVGVFPNTTTAFSLTNMSHLAVIRNDTFAELRMLVTVKMNGNFRLTEIGARAFGEAGASQVAVVNLSGNALTTLHVSTLNWADVDVLDLRDNPWRCDCHLAWVKRLSAKVTSQVTCRTPRSARNRSLAGLASTELTCPAPTRHRLLKTLVVSASLGVVLVAGVATLVIRRRQRQVRVDVRGSSSVYSSIYNVVRNEEGEDEGEEVCFLRGSGTCGGKATPVHV